ncbi:PREDICTED: uncharacterized protein LOC109581489 isoform X6 [Amphimedon queenslandica]|uniref:PHD-type domain-containing protein n=1 Tax=Amphimedon queenslandica TaxID=400682 RepID=A0AAN0J387_AMPQE|nr:PREDICTED: uncharacterized protein LOC109581489 isoform X6 [Amphimedon queenslandica]|eukprot:XP_019851186.1 PREDICTED: uncharacterized protein LOC109581489 isoform X6 [Amphimedon queenslandica]
MFPHPPLVKRIVRSKVQAQHSPCLDDSVLLGQPRRSYRKWNDKSMQKAAKAVEEGTMSLRMASEKYSVPKSTLHDRVTGKTDFEARPGPSPYLSFEEEEELASFLIKTAKIGYPRTKRQVLALVERIVSARGICTSVTNGWWERFCKRHPQMTLKMAMPLSYVRAAATDPVILNKYFDTLEETLTDNDILNRPVHIFNCDETGMPLNPKCLKIVDKKGSKNPSYITSNTKAQVTVHACTCAAGYAIPPFVIFKRKSLNPELTKNEVPGTLYGLSENGWMTKDLFYYWFREHFLLYAPQVRPLLLLMDGHATHYSPETIRLAASHKVIIFVLPPNTTHITQALDKGCFGPLKVAWRHLCHEFFVDNPEKATLSLYDFSGIFSEAWARAFSVKNIQSSFKVTGICPLNKSVLEKYVSITEPDSEEKFSVFQPANLARKNGIKHLPLYSPSRSCCHDVSKSAHSELDESLDGFEKHLLERSSRSFKESSVAPSHDSSKISRFLIPPVSPRKSQVDEKALCKVLTSQDSIRLMKDKEEKKQHEARLKEMRKQDRLRKQKVQQSKASGVKVSFAKNQVILEDSDGFQSEVESDCELNVQSDFELDCSYAEWRGKESQSDYESEPSTKTGTRGQKKKLVDIQPQSDYESEPSTETGTRGRKKKLVDIQPQSNYESEPSTKTGRGRKKKLVDIQPQSDYESEPSTKTGRGQKKKLVDIQPQSDYESEPSTKTGARGRKKKLVDIQPQSDYESEPSTKTGRGRKKKLVDIQPQSDYESEPSTKTGTRGRKKKLVDIQPQSHYESEPSTKTGTRGRKKKLVDIQPQSDYESEPSTKTRGRKKKLVDIQPQSDYESEPSTKTGTRGRKKKLVDIQPQSDYESEPSTKTRGRKKKLVDIQPQSDYESEPSTKTGTRGRKKKLVDIQPQSDDESEPSTKTGTRGRKKKLVDIQPQSDYESEPSTKTRGRKKKLVDIQPQSDYESEPSTKTRGRKKKLVDIQPQSDDESEPSTKTGRRGRKKKLVDIQPQSDDESEPSTKTGTRGQKKKLVDIHPQSDYESVPSTKTGIGIRGRKKKPLDIQPQSDYESEQYTRARDDYVELSDCESINQSIGGTKGSSRSACSSLKDKEDAYLDQWWIKDLKLYNADKESLKSTVPLTDNIINAAQVLLKLQYPHISGWQDTLLEKKMNFDVISSYPAIQLLFVGKNHWICTCAMTPGTVTVMDSLQLYSRLRKATVNLISHVYRYHTFLKSLKIETLAVQQQEGYTDCALFSIAYAVELCLGNNPENSCFDQGQLRNHLYKCFVNKSLIPFPKQKVEPLPRPRRLYYEVKIFCYCRLPENYDKMMIMCDLCQEWYHCSCAGIKESELDDIDDWMCDICNKY